MQTAIEALWKSKEKILMGWTPEPVAGITSYNIYVGLAPVLSSLTILQTNVPPYRSENSPATLKKVSWEVTINSVRTVLGLAPDVDFSNTLFYFAITYLNPTESDITRSILVSVPPVGIGALTRNSDVPTFERFIFGFSGDSQKWVKAAVTSTGAIIMAPSDFDKANITTEYTYDTTNVKTMKSYPSDQTVAGSPAKLTTYTWVGSQVTKIVVTDSTV